MLLVISLFPYLSLGYAFPHLLVYLLVALPNKAYGQKEFPSLKPNNKTYDYKQGESCGIIFGKSQPRFLEHGGCADPSYELVCEGNKTVLNLYYGRHRVQAITVTYSSTLRSVSAGVDHDNCSTTAVNSISYNNFTDVFLEKLTKNIQYKPYYSQNSIAFLTCKNPVTSITEGSAATCTRQYDSSTRNYTYVLFRDAEVSEFDDSCSIDLIVNIWLSAPMTCNENCSNPEVRIEQVNWLELRWLPIPCGHWDNEPYKSQCRLDKNSNLVLCRPDDSYVAVMLISSIFLSFWLTAIGLSVVLLPPSEPLLAWQRKPAAEAGVGG
ncbi:hypothetical protein L6164_036844 [Bauhinia variegata]|uniref:Uncharacterized protein n=1 Tax=Bauhinia variegata TaxID=167791 RepID=A0ACB9KIC6_BAUVA|nr:hypothetical protein L6164_036844 [Bauhinia variegata]